MLAGQLVRPLVYLTNAATVAAVQRGSASAQSAACVGPGPVYSIMRFPRADIGEAGTGRVLSLTPPRSLAAPAIAAKKATDGGDDQAQAWRDYEAALRALWLNTSGTAPAARLRPGALSYGCEAHGGAPGAMPWDGGWWTFGGPVDSGATLICACSRQAAADRRCHRVIAAELLARAHWRVILDGVQLEERS